MVAPSEYLAGQGVYFGDALNLAAEKLYAQCSLHLCGRDNFDTVATHPEGPTFKSDVIAHVLHGDEAPQ